MVRRLEQQEQEQEQEAEATREESSGMQLIQATSYEDEELQEQMLDVVRLLLSGCIFCRLYYADQEQGDHSYDSCTRAYTHGCGHERFLQWLPTLELRAGQDCYRCGLSQSVCRWVEEGGECEYRQVAVQGMFILHQLRILQDIVEGVGFTGPYKELVW